MEAPEPPRVRHPVMLQHWRWLTFLHWRYPAEVVQAQLPERLTVETFDGTAWVGLVPFLMDRVRAPGLPAIPWLSRFPETNVRTYVRGPDGRTGIWFLSLDADRLAPVLTARATYGLPYYWSSMAVRRADGHVSYGSRRRWPGPAGAGCDARVAFGDPLADRELTTLDIFLTARYRLYSTLAGRLVVAEAEHPPWSLRRAAVPQLREDLVRAAGLPPPDHEPVLHASDGVEVRIGAWRPVSRR
jgi:uncharacterized protein YqjF (DUF2071 family)